ncbi:DNA-directed RNA polymerase subunit E'' [Candidatus Woesearchaeota archaeon]|nr:DNA-directed RNA polymerase subunit E'' [Candidatus Woesearchaeota archaeon]
MAKKKVCRKCKIFVKGNECPICKGSDVTASWKGRIIIVDAKKSEIAKKLGINVGGEYAIRIK